MTTPLTWVSKLSDDEVCRIYARLRTTSAMAGNEIVEAWRALGERDRAEATERMRHELALLAPTFTGHP